MFLKKKSFNCILKNKASTQNATDIRKTASFYGFLSTNWKFCFCLFFSWVIGLFEESICRSSNIPLNSKETLLSLHSKKHLFPLSAYQHHFFAHACLCSSLKVYAKSISQFDLSIYCWRVKLSSDVRQALWRAASSYLSASWGDPQFTQLHYDSGHSPQARVVFCEKVESLKVTQYIAKFPWMIWIENWQVSGLVPFSPQHLLKGEWATFHFHYKEDFQWIIYISDHYSHNAIGWL